MAVARSEQDGDISRLRRTPHAGRAIAYRRAGVAQDRGDLGGDPFRRRMHRPASEKRDRIRRARVTRSRWKPVAFVVAETVASRARNVAGDLAEHVIDEGENARVGSKRHSYRLARTAVGSQPFDELRGFVNNGDVGIAETVNRLLPVADDEDRRL